MPEEAAVGEAVVAAEGVHSARCGLEGRLADEERGEAYEELCRASLELRYGNGPSVKEDVPR